MQKCKVSVALCTYNGSKYLLEQLQSICSQTINPDEIVICDDKSIDDCFKIAQNFIPSSNTIIKVYKNETQLGVKKNFEKALALCSGEFIFLSDQDDIWLPDKVEKTLAYFESNKEKSVVFSNAFLIENQIATTKTIWDERNFSKKIREKFKNPLLLLRYLLLDFNLATGATMALRKSILKKHLPFILSDNYLHDYIISLQAAAEGSLGYIDECLIYYRIHENQVIELKKTPAHLKIYYRLLDVGKNALNLGKIRNEKILMAKHLLNYTDKSFPQAKRFLESSIKYVIRF